MRRARSGNNSDGGSVEVSAILEGKGPAGLYIKQAAEGKKDRGRKRVGYHRSEYTCLGARLHHRKAADKRTAGFCSLPRSIAEPFRRS
jgi:hypothetical protein